MLDLTQRFSVIAKENGASVAEVSNLRQRYPSIPVEYVDLIQYCTELELEYDDEIYLRIWGPSGVVEMDEGYEISLNIKGAIPIGDDGGGKVIFYGNGPKGWGLYVVGFGDLDIDDAVWLSPSLEKVLREGIGMDKI